MGKLAFTAAAIAILAGASSAEAMEQALATQYGVACNGSTDDSAALQAAINAVAVKGGILQIPAAICDHASTLKRPRNVRIQGQGANVSILRYTGSAEAWVVGDTGSVQNAYQGGFSDLTLKGPSYSGSVVGIYLGADQAGVISPIGTNANNEAWLRVNVENFGLGVQVANNAYIFSCANCLFFNNGQHWKDASTNSNSGEGMRFSHGVFGQSQSSTVPAVELDNNIGDYYFSEEEFDYNNSNQPDVACLAGTMHATFTNSHFEKAHGEYIHINNTVCNGKIHFFGGEFSTTGTGSTDNDMIGLSGIYQSQNVVSVFGAAVNSNETLSAFVDANNPSRQVTLDSLDWENYGNLYLGVNARGNPLGIAIRNTQGLANVGAALGTILKELGPPAAASVIVENEAPAKAHRSEPTR